MFIVYADRAGWSNDPSRREGFEAESFSHTLSDDASRGSVILRPDGRVLNVASAADGYERIRIFNERGDIAAAMTRTPHGQVIWTVSMWVEDRAQVSRSSDARGAQVDK